MNSGSYRAAFIAFVAGLASAVLAYKLVMYAIPPIEEWYFHKFVEPTNPDPTWPPLMWAYIFIPLPVAAIIGGLITRYVYKRKVFSPQ